MQRLTRNQYTVLYRVIQMFQCVSKSKCLEVGSY
jgi:hypothetical protein